MRIFSAIVITVASVLCCINGELTECHSWSKISDFLLQRSRQVSCKINDNCTKMNCSGIIQGEEFHAGMLINYCANPISITIHADVPQFGIHNWQRSFTNRSVFDISDIGGVKGEISLQKEKNNLMIGLSMNVLSGASKFIPKLVRSPIRISIFNETTFPIPSCETASPGTTLTSVTEQVYQTTMLNIEQLESLPRSYSKVIRNCLIVNSSCQKEEICIQLDESSPDGVCICRGSYLRDITGQCVYNPESSPTTDVQIIPTPESQAAEEGNTSAPILRTAILVSVTVVLLLVGIAYAVVRFKVFQYLRRKFRVQVYEQVLLGQQDDNDEPLTDPVA